MSMKQSDFIALALAIHQHNLNEPDPFTHNQLNTLAEFCTERNAAFKRDRWMEIVRGS